MDHFTRRIVGFGVHCSAAVDGVGLCRNAEGAETAEYVLLEILCDLSGLRVDCRGSSSKVELQAELVESRGQNP